MSEHIATIGSQIRVIRKAKQLTQELVAERVGIETKSLGRLERGSREPSVAMLKKLADALEVSVRDFFPEEPKNSSTPVTLREVRCRLHEFIPQADETTLLRWYRETF